MPVSWSWPWGQEAATLLEDKMGFDFANTSATYGQPDSTTVYSYVGSGTRYSWAQDNTFGANYFILPTEAWVPTGWLCAPFYADGTITNSWMVQIKGATSAENIYIKHTSGGNGELYVKDTFKANFSGLTANNWHFLAIKYDMSGTTWSGRAYLNGSAVTAAQTQGSATAETAGEHIFYGIVGGTRTTYWGGIIVYNSASDAGEAPRFVTRLAPNADTSETGTWTPSSGATNFGITAPDPFVNTDFTQVTIPASGDDVVTEVNNVATQIGVAPTAIDGITNHTYSSGTSVTVNASTGAGGSYTTGTNVVPDASDTTYGFSTAPIDPSTSAAWAVSPIPTVLFKYEVV